MTSRTLKIAGLFSLIAALVIAVVAGTRFWRLVSFARQKEVGVVMIESLRDKRPSNTPIQNWDNAINWTITAYQNVFFSVDSVASGELDDFTDEARTKFAGEVDTESLDWVWDRLAETGVSGKQYVDRFEPEYRAASRSDPINDPH